MKEFDRLLEIIRKLRGPRGCPWDRKQKLTDYKRYLIEEAYELIEAIDCNDPEMVKEEVGDLLLILTVVTEFFNDKKVFDVEAALKMINQKLIIRHPHVFSKKKIGDSDAVLKYWVRQKAKKKKRKTIADRLPKGAPALFLAELFCREYANVKAKDFQKIKTHPEVLAKATAQDILKLPEKNADDAFAQILFQLSVLAYIHGVDAESALHGLTRDRAARTPYGGAGKSKSEIRK